MNRNYLNDEDDEDEPEPSWFIQMVSHGSIHLLTSYPPSSSNSEANIFNIKN